MASEAELQRSFGVDVIDTDYAFEPFTVQNRVWSPRLDDIRIAVTGANSTGITTVARDLARALGLPLLSEVARAVFEHGFKPGIQGSMASQSTIWFTQYFLEQRTSNFVTDRFVLCATAHAEVLAEFSGTEQDRTCSTTMSNATAEAMAQYTAIFYTPIEFPLIADGVRDEDDAFRERLDRKILELFERFDVPYHRLQGTPEERQHQALEVLARIGVKPSNS